MTIDAVFLVAAMAIAPSSPATPSQLALTTASPSPFARTTASPPQLALTPASTLVPTLMATGESSGKKGWPLALKLAVGEAAIAGLSSAGHISEQSGHPAKEGAQALGAGLVATGAGLLAFWPMINAGAQTKEDHDGMAVIGVGLLGMIAAGGYDLYLHEKKDPNGAEVFRDNMIALNAVPLVTWGIAKLAHWSP